MTDTLQRGFLTAEDEALKAKLSGITVDGIKVRTHFRMPDQSVQRIYPMITIELVDVVFASERNHSSEIITADYWPSEYPTFNEWWVAQGNDAIDNNVSIPVSTRWQPYDLVYQVSTLCRSIQHDRIITRTLMGTAYLPANNWGYLPVPQDGSQRWLDRVSMTQQDYYEGTSQRAARVFRKVYDLKVSAHFPPEDPFVFYRVLSVHNQLNVSNSSVNPVSTTYAP